MTQLLETSKQLLNWMMSWIMGHNDEDCNCNWADDEDDELQESSGLGTVIVVSALLVGLFITANLIPSQGTQGARSLRDEELRRQQQMHRIKQLLHKTSHNSRKNNTDIENWQDALSPSEEEEEEREEEKATDQHARQLHLKLAQSMQEIYHDLSSHKSEEDCYKEILEE